MAEIGKSKLKYGGYMIEFYILIAVICNIITDFFVYLEVRRMGKVHSDLLSGFTEFCESLGPALTEHAKRVSKGLTGAIGYYQGKAKEAVSGEIDGISDIVGALGPLAQLVSADNAPSPKKGGGKYHL